MIKFVMCLRRNPKLSRKEFQDYWRDKHAPLFMSFAEVHNARRYVQDHTVDSPMNEFLRDSRGMLEPFDGVAEVWFDSEEAFAAAMSSPEGQKLGEVLHADESTFIDHSRSTAFLATEHEV